MEADSLTAQQTSNMPQKRAHGESDHTANTANPPLEECGENVHVDDATPHTDPQGTYGRARESTTDAGRGTAATNDASETQ